MVACLIEAYCPITAAGSPLILLPKLLAGQSPHRPVSKLFPILGNG